MFKNIIAAVALLLAIKSVFAQKIDTVGVNNLKEVVITGQYAPQSEKNAVYKVKVIDTEVIQQKAANNLRELLQQELNINLSQNSVFGTSIDIQGISKENIKILIDGVPVVGRLNGVIDLNQINLNAIEKVEIIEGPVSVFYGTDAMGGIINLITKKSYNDIVEGSIATYFESINATNLNGDFGYKFGKNTIRFNGGYYGFNGLSTNKSPRNLNWEERNQVFTDFMISRKINQLNVRFNNRYSREKLVSIGEPDRRGNILDKNYYTTRKDNSLSLQGALSKNYYLDVYAAYLDYQRYHDTFDYNPDTQTSQLNLLDTKNDNIVTYNFTNVKAQIGNNNSTKKINYALGTEFISETSDGGRILSGSQSINTTAFFGSLNYKLSNKIEVQPGARYTYNSAYGSLFSPALNSKVKFNNNTVLRFSYARGFRAPSIKELYLDFQISAGPLTYIISGNESLNVEKSHSFNLVYSVTTYLKNGSSLLIEPSVFYNDISNLISLSEMENFSRNYINIDKFKSVGGKLDIILNASEYLTLNSGISIIGRYNEFNETFDTNEFLYTPEITSNVNYLCKKTGLNLNVFYKFTGKRTGFYLDTDTNNLVKTSRRTFNNLDATLSKTFLNNTLKTSVGVKNAFDIEDIETVNELGQAHSTDMQLWGRSFFVQTNIYF